MVRLLGSRLSADLVVGSGVMATTRRQLTSLKELLTFAINKSRISQASFVSVAKSCRIAKRGRRVSLRSFAR